MSLPYIKTPFDLCPPLSENLHRGIFAKSKKSCRNRQEIPPGIFAPYTESKYQLISCTVVFEYKSDPSTYDFYYPER